MWTPTDIPPEVETVSGALDWMNIIDVSPGHSLSQEDANRYGEHTVRKDEFLVYVPWFDGKGHAREAVLSREELLKWAAELVELANSKTKEDTDVKF